MEEKICPVCELPLVEGSRVTVCPDCGTFHHLSCWERNNGCGISNCTKRFQAIMFQKSGNTCPKCGVSLAPGQDFCHRCGYSASSITETPPTAGNFCGKCGKILLPDQAFCPHCGQKSGTAYTPDDNAVTGKTGGGKKKSGKIIAIAASVITVCVLIFFVLSSGSIVGPNFNKLYSEYCVSTWASVGSDGSYLSIDTNPYNNDDDGLAYPAAYTAIKNVNKALGLPDSLLTDMEETAGVDGRQTQDFPDQHISVSWRYHPDKGLEVTYKKMK
ncbi:MAG: zinc ribbon domain-containing protein [Oscillospiraceae bacterium]|nr:zinc ribbon domain-containing protein [Oscillospiraceae bacterium]